MSGRILDQRRVTDGFISNRSENVLMMIFKKGMKSTISLKILFFHAVSHLAAMVMCQCSFMLYLYGVLLQHPDHGRLFSVKSVSTK